jgi:hypothetical protein
MKSIRILASLALASALTAGAGASRAGDPPTPTPPPVPAPVPTEAATPTPTPAAIPAETHAETNASATATMDAEAKAKLDALKRRITEQSEKVNADAKVKAEGQLTTMAREIDDHAATGGDDKLAGRLADEFGISADAVAAEKSALGASWGDLTIAHSICANSKTDVTVEQLMSLKKDGMGWGQIAAGLELKLGSVVSSVKAESQVARGIAKADGKVAAMQGAGARVGVGANAGLHAGVGKGKADAAVGAGAGVKVGGKVKP